VNAALIAYLFAEDAMSDDPAPTEADLARDLLMFGGPREGYQYPPCPHPECRALVPVREDAPGGEYLCLCHACTVAPLRDVRGVIRLDLVRGGGLT
jgi:hypothetical protein